MAVQIITSLMEQLPYTMRHHKPITVVGTYLSLEIILLFLQEQPISIRLMRPIMGGMMPI